ncbi:DUF6350 family protein [Streptomyces thermoviolaceus]|uniref:cell division protein PerM n=1 Tax=Streptomyces thermoviolaceus TaxID=1952 RepID=UPI00203E951C|nr:DUF6350 family protein [Streptomyces thermoviolaceus]MCM3263732.1 DUF6350 family protein [Streptomyces thermoviolaceus]
MAGVIQTKNRRRPPLASPPARLRSRSPGFGAGLLGGAVAAGLGLGATAVLVIVLWISSPDPDGSPGSALRVAAALWLLAHGAELVRTGTLTGADVPLGVTPLLLLLLPTVLLHRAGRDATDPGDGGPLVPPRTAWSGVVAGYLSVVGAAAGYAQDGPLRPSWPWAVLWVPLVTAVAAGSGVWAAYGCPRAPLERALSRLSPGVRRLLLMPGPRARLGPSARAAGAGALMFTGGGALVLGVSLVWHSGAAQAGFVRLTEGWAGRFAVLLLCLALLPNAVLWAVAYTLGPGFQLGAGHLVTPVGSAPAPLLPPFPLLAAVPDAGPGTRLHWACAAVPVAAGATIGWFVADAATGEVRDADGDGRAWSWRRTAGGAALACLVCALGLGAAAQLAGGALGHGVLARFGPAGWQVAGAAVLWTVPVAVPTALLVWVWRRWASRLFRRARSAVRIVGPRHGDTVGPRHGDAQPAGPAQAAAVRVPPRYDDASAEPYDALPLDPAVSDPTAWPDDHAAHRPHRPGLPHTPWSPKDADPAPEPRAPQREPGRAADGQDGEEGRAGREQKPAPVPPSSSSRPAHLPTAPRPRPGPQAVPPPAPQDPHDTETVPRPGTAGVTPGDRTTAPAPDDPDAAPAPGSTPGPG